MKVRLESNSCLALASVYGSTGGDLMCLNVVQGQEEAQLHCSLGSALLRHT